MKGHCSYDLHQQRTVAGKARGVNRYATDFKVHVLRVCGVNHRNLITILQTLPSLVGVSILLKEATVRQELRQIQKNRRNKLKLASHCLKFKVPKRLKLTRYLHSNKSIKLMHIAFRINWLFFHTFQLLRSVKTLPPSPSQKSTCFS